MTIENRFNVSKLVTFAFFKLKLDLVKYEVGFIFTYVQYLNGEITSLL